MTVQKIKSGRINTVNAETHVEQKGTIFYNEEIGDLRLGDGVTPGGILLNLGGGTGDGYTGSMGYTGSRGITGYVGSQGIQGIQGPSGGYTGSVGYVGSKGDQGPAGGYTGSQGQIGSIGPAGTVIYEGGIPTTDFSVGININCGGVT